MKKLFVVFVSVLCVLSACHKGPNPKESLIAAGNALHDCDADKIDKYIDLTGIISNIIDYAVKKDISGVEKNQIMEMAAAKMIIVPIVKQYILSGIRTLEKSEYKEYMDLIKVKKYEILSNKDGIASAKVTLDFEEGKKYALEKNLIPSEAQPFMDTQTPPLVLKMKQDGDYWKIVDITNLDEIVSVYEKLYKEFQAKEKEKEAEQEPLRIMGAILSAEQRHYLAFDSYTEDFDKLDLDFPTGDGTSAKGPSFKTNKGDTYTIDKEKVSAHIIAPKEYYLERYYSTGKISCKDNNNGMCLKLGL